MRGKPDHNFPQFHEVEKALWAWLEPERENIADHGILNPADDFGGDASRPLVDYMQVDIQQVLDADVIVLLPEWQKSQGAGREISVGLWTGKRFMEAHQIRGEDGEQFWDFNDVDITNLDRPASYETKDSGKRVEFATGMQRDITDGKPRFDLITPLGLAFDDQMLTRWARLMARGAAKYTDRNWEKSSTPEELERFRQSAFRHFMEWFCGLDDEDHAAAVLFNISGAEYVKCRA
jgi:hypothetical protein